MLPVPRNHAHLVREQMKSKHAHKRMVILCLINAAAYSRAYFQQLEPHLAAHGCTVVYALDSHLSDVMYAEGRPIENAAYFTDYCRSRIPITPDFADDCPQGWSLLYSDFDRFLTMNIRPPLKDDGPLRYEHVPRLLHEFFEGLFSEHKPAAVVYEQASNSFALAALTNARRNGVPFCSIAPARIPGRIEVSLTGGIEDYRALTEYLEEARAGEIDEAFFRIAAEYIAKIDAVVPDYMKEGQAGAMLARVGLFDRYGSLEKFRHLNRAWQYRRKYSDDIAFAYQHGDPILLSWAYFCRAMRRRIRYNSVRRLYKTAPRPGRFLLYPLHFHPEASTSVLAPDFTDEMHVIKSIAFRLPSNMRLVVKEHPSAVALQPKEFYRQLSELPNVDLLAAEVSAKRLARDSVGVVCVTSTLGFEAAAMGKPVIALGDVLYGYFPNVRMVRASCDIGPAIEWALAYPGCSKQHVYEAVAAYAAFTAEGAFDFRASLGDAAALQSVANLLLERLATVSPRTHAD